MGHQKASFGFRKTKNLALSVTVLRHEITDVSTTYNMSRTHVHKTFFLNRVFFETVKNSSFEYDDGTFCDESFLDNLKNSLYEQFFVH